MNRTILGTPVPTSSAPFVQGKLYEIPSSQTDIRRTFREKYGWVGPEEQRKQAEMAGKGGVV